MEQSRVRRRANRAGAGRLAPVGERKVLRKEQRGYREKLRLPWHIRDGIRFAQHINHERGRDSRVAS